MYRSMTAEEIRFTGDADDELNAYFARPTDAGPFGGVIVIHHMPGWDEQTMEITRRFADRGYLADGTSAGVGNQLDRLGRGGIVDIVDDHSRSGRLARRCRRRLPGSRRSPRRPIPRRHARRHLLFAVAR